MARLLLWSLVALIILLILAAIVVELVLRTDMPRQMVVEQVQRELGLVVQARAMSIGWTGRTVLQDVTLSLPLSDRAFLEVPTLRIEHANLPWLIITRDMDIQAIDLQRPELFVLEDEAGRWNLLEVAALLGRTAGAEPAAQEAPQRGPMVLPRLHIHQGTVRIIDNAGRQATISPLNVTGRPAPLQWEYRVTVPDLDHPDSPHLDLYGQLVPGQFWQHQVGFVIQRIDPWLRDWIDSPDLHLSGRWRGEVQDGRLLGRLRLSEPTHLAGVAAHGAVLLEAGDEGVIIRPDDLIVLLIQPEGDRRPNDDDVLGAAKRNRITNDELVMNVQAMNDQTRDNRQSSTESRHPSSLRFNAGRIIIRDDVVAVDEIGVEGFGGVAVASGYYVHTPQAGELELRWRDVTPVENLRLAGALTASLKTPWPQRQEIQVTLTADADTPAGYFDTVAKLRGQGRSWREMDFTADLQRLRWTGEQQRLAVRNLSADLRLSQDKLELTAVRHPAAGQFRGQGAVNFADKNADKKMFWWLWLQADEWAPPDLEGTTVDTVLDAWGDREQVNLDQFYLRAAALEADLSGSWDFQRPEPVDVWLHVAHMPPATGLPEPEPAMISGDLHSLLHVSGTLSPLRLIIEGEAFPQNLVVRGRLLPDIEMVVRGDIDGNRARLETERLDMLGASWRLMAQYPTDEELDDRPAMLDIRFEGLDLAEVGDLLERDELSGAVNGQIVLHTRELRLDRLRGSGRLDGRDIAFERFVADTAEASLELRGGWVEVHPIRLHRAAAAEDEEPGWAELRLAGDIMTRNEWVLQHDIQNWPIDIEETGGRAVIWSEADLWFDLRRRAAVGPLVLRSDFYLGGRPLGTTMAEVQAFDRVISVERVAINAFGGDGEGRANIDLNNPLESHGHLRFNDLSAEQVKAIFPGVEDLYGSFSGLIRARATPPQPPPQRPLAPVEVTVIVLSENGRYRTVEVGNADLTFYVDQNRVVLVRSPVQLAGGMLHVWARASKRGEHAWTSLEDIRSQFIVEYENLELNQFVQVGDQPRQPLLGRLTGELTLAGNLGRREAMFGDGIVHVSRSDLGNFAPLALLYSLARADLGPAPATGTGSAELRLEAGTFRIDNISYFHRGLEVSADMTIENIFRGAESPIGGSALGTARPLAEVRLPLIRDLDHLLAVIQRDFTGIEIHGTLGEPRADPVPFDRLTEPLRRLLGGDGGGRPRRP